MRDEADENGEIRIRHGGQETVMSGLGGHNSTIRGFVSRYRALLEEAEKVKLDMEELTVQAKGAGFDKATIAAMKKVAKLVQDDKVGQAREALRVLNQVSDEAGVDLFNWSADE